MGVSYVKMISTVARILWLYDVELQPGSTLVEGSEGVCRWEEAERGVFQLRRDVLRGKVDRRWCGSIAG